jgi:DNA sulfur modification protein DndC
LLKDGSFAKNPQRMGPLTFDARLMGLDRVLCIQSQCNAIAIATGRPVIDLINPEEEARIRELIALETWPQGWDGDEPHADVVMDTVYWNGAVQPRLFSEADI